MVPLFIGRRKPEFAIFFIRAGDGPLFRQIGGVPSGSRQNQPRRGRSPVGEGFARKEMRKVQPTRLVGTSPHPGMEIGPHEDFSPSDSGQHRGARRRLVGRHGPAENALRGRLWWLLWEEYWGRGNPDLA